MHDMIDTLIPSVMRSYSETVEVHLSPRRRNLLSRHIVELKTKFPLKHKKELNRNQHQKTHRQSVSNTDQNQTQTSGESKTRSSGGLQSPRTANTKLQATLRQMCRAPQGQERNVMTLLQRLLSQWYVVWGTL